MSKARRCGAWAMAWTVWAIASVSAQSPMDYSRAAELATKVTVQIQTSDFTGKRWAMKVGAGTILTADGMVVTCSHVLGTHFKVRVRLYNGRVYEARVLGRFPEHDLAILKFNPPEDVPFAPRLHTGLLPPQSPAICLGFPRGTRKMVPAKLKGYATGPEESHLPDDVPTILFSAAIVPGYSGGPLMTLDGGIIGVVFARMKDEGAGIAVPVEVLLKDLQRIPQEDAAPEKKKASDPPK